MKKTMENIGYALVLFIIAFIGVKFLIYTKHAFTRMFEDNSMTNEEIVNEVKYCEKNGFKPVYRYNFASNIKRVNCIKIYD